MTLKFCRYHGSTAVAPSAKFQHDISILIPILVASRLYAILLGVFLSNAEMGPWNGPQVPLQPCMTTHNVTLFRIGWAHAQNDPYIPIQWENYILNFDLSQSEKAE